MTERGGEREIMLLRDSTKTLVELYDKSGIHNALYSAGKVVRLKNPDAAIVNTVYTNDYELAQAHLTGEQEFEGFEFASPQDDLIPQHTVSSTLYLRSSLYLEGSPLRKENGQMPQGSFSAYTIDIGREGKVSMMHVKYQDGLLSMSPVKRVEKPEWRRSPNAVAFNLVTFLNNPSTRI